MNTKVTLLVEINIKAENLSDFIDHTLIAAKEAIKEEGCLRYAFFQNPYQVTQFFLMEEYVNDAAFNSHKETVHFKEWKTAIEGMKTETNKVKTLDEIQ